MAGIIVATHGELAAALLSTLKMVLGETEALEAVSVEAADTRESMTLKLEAALQRVDPKGQGALLLVDMKGGTPFNCGMMLASARQVRLVTGVNLPMLFKAVFHRSEGDLDRLAREVAEEARNAVTTSTDLLNPT